MIKTFWSRIFKHKRISLQPAAQPIRQPRVFVDASSFDPDTIHMNGRAVIIVAQDVEDCIYEWVKQELRKASGVVLLDLGSADGTPYYAAQAGAVVVLQNQAADFDDALCRAMGVAMQFSEHVDVIER